MLDSGVSGLSLRVVDGWSRCLREGDGGGGGEGEESEEVKVGWLCSFGLVRLRLF